MEKDLKESMKKLVDKQREAFEQAYQKVVEENKQETRILGEKIFEMIRTTFVDSETTYEELDEKFDLKNNDNIAKPKYSKGLFKVRLCFEEMTYLEAYANAIVFSGYEETDLKNRKITLWYCGDCIADIVQYKNDIEIIDLD